MYRKKLAIVIIIFVLILVLILILGFKSNNKTNSNVIVQNEYYDEQKDVYVYKQKEVYMEDIQDDVEIYTEFEPIN